MCITFLARRDCRFSNPRSGEETFGAMDAPPKESAFDSAEPFNCAAPCRRFWAKSCTKPHTAFAFMASQQVDVELSCVNPQSDVTYNLRQRKPVL